MGKNCWLLTSRSDASFLEFSMKFVDKINHVGLQGQLIAGLQQRRRGVEELIDAGGETRKAPSSC
jgi:hypothetical protein